MADWPVRADRPTCHSHDRWQQAKKKMTSKKYNSVGKVTALISFIIRILIFGTYFFTSNADLLFLGYGFVVLAGIVNLIILIIILTKAQSDKANRKGLLKTGGLMLLNLPIMFACIWVAMIVLGNMRITFTNGTQNKLTDIKIVGCETEHIAELKPNESKTVWVGITGDCSIAVEYLENGEQKSETVAGYVTGGMGQKMKHKIDGQDKDIL
ncbi:hypothetical protein [Maribacter sp. 2210JD10-5]|uniref:hypothetical protein n=1 Tax=Maribacter sp. 2210JD10-5 TaxID=3386272 RepID=UPI0039BC3FF3